MYTTLLPLTRLLFITKATKICLFITSSCMLSPSWLYPLSLSLNFLSKNMCHSLSSSLIWCLTIWSSLMGLGCGLGWWWVSDGNLGCGSWVVTTNLVAWVWAVDGGYWFGVMDVGGGWYLLIWWLGCGSWMLAWWFVIWIC